MTAGEELRVAGAVAVAQIGRWEITVVPAEWSLMPDFGISRRSPSGVLSNVHLTEDTLLAGKSLGPYVEVQKVLMRRTFEDPIIAGPGLVPFPEVDESLLMMVKHRSDDGSRDSGRNVVQVQHYVRRAMWIGIVTFTTTEGEMAGLRPALQTFIDGLRVGE